MFLWWLLLLYFPTFTAPTHIYLANGYSLHLLDVVRGSDAVVSRFFLGLTADLLMLALLEPGLLQSHVEPATAVLSLVLVLLVRPI